MLKFRTRLSMAIVTKELVIEAKNFNQAEEAFRTIDTDTLMSMADSMEVVRHDPIVRVPDSVKVNVTLKGELPVKQEDLLAAVLKNQEQFESLLKRLPAKSEGEEAGTGTGTPTG